MTRSEKKASKSQWRINHFLAIGVMIVIVVTINAFSSKYFYRDNLSGTGFSELSSQTVNILKNLETEVRIINFFSPGTDAAASLISYDVDRILEEFEYFGGNKVDVRRVDPELDFEEAQLIAEEFRLSIAENVLIIQIGDQHRTLNYSELAQVEMPGRLNFGSPPRVQAFLAEGVLAEAITSLTEDETSKIYFLSGHGEYDPSSPENDRLGYSLIAARIARQNAEIESLNLIQSGNIPADCDLLVIAGPRTRLLPEEIEMLRLYVEPEDAQANRLMILLDPQTETGLETLLEESYGVRFRNDILLAKVDFLGQVRTLTQTVVADFADHPAVDWIDSMGANFQVELGTTRSIELLPAEGAARRESRVELMRTPEGYWGETGELNEASRFDSGEDTPGPLTVGALIDEGSVSGGEVQLQGDRIVLLGSGNFLINETLQAHQVDLTVNLINWMLERENKLGIAPKLPQEYQLTLSGNESAALTLINGGIIVLAVTVLLLTWARKRK